jgi:two-component system response regulator DevR
MNAPDSAGLLRILLVDDHAVVRAGLRNLINDEPGLRVVAEAATCAEALNLAAGTRPDVVVLDLRLPDGVGVEIIDPLKRLAAGLRVLVLTSFADDTLLLGALKAGADGYLLKDVAEADLLGAIRQVAAAGVAMPQPRNPETQDQNQSASNDQPSPLPTLTGQERRVFELVGRGHSNREVAKLTGLTEKTVRNYLTRVFDKLGLRRRSELTALYVSSRPWRREPARRHSG